MKKLVGLWFIPRKSFHNYTSQQARSSGFRSQPFDAARELWDQEGLTEMLDCWGLAIGCCFLFASLTWRDLEKWGPTPLAGLYPLSSPHQTPKPTPLLSLEARTKCWSTLFAHMTGFAMIRASGSIFGEANQPEVWPRCVLGSGPQPGLFFFRYGSLWYYVLYKYCLLLL